MDIDFSLVLTLAVLITGLLWGFDASALKPIRLRRLQAARAAATQQGASLPAETEQKLVREPWLFETAHSFFPVLAVVWVLRSFLAEPFTIPSGSMLPSLQIGDYVLVNKFAYGVRLPVLGTLVLPVSLPARGDVMVFKFPANPSVNYIKRVIGLPGDHIESRHEVLFINGIEAKRELLSQEPAIEPWQQVWREDLLGVKHITREEIGREPAGDIGPLARRGYDRGREITGRLVPTVGGQVLPPDRVVDVTAEVECALDELEEVWPQATGEYVKRHMDVQVGEQTFCCIVYEISAERIAGCKVIASGDWIHGQ